MAAPSTIVVKIAAALALAAIAATALDLAPRASHAGPITAKAQFATNECCFAFIF